MRSTNLLPAVALTAFGLVLLGFGSTSAPLGFVPQPSSVLPSVAESSSLAAARRGAVSQAPETVSVAGVSGRGNSAFVSCALVACASIALAASRRHAVRAALVERRLRLAGKEVPRNKELAWALMCSIFGIGKTTAFVICKECGLDPHKRVSELTEEEELRLVDETGKYTLENPLRRMYKANCQMLLEIKHRRGIRMEKGLPVRYQRTKTNNRCARMLNPWRV